MTTLEPAADAGPRGGPIRRVVALAAPLLMVGLAALLWLLSDRLLYIGPFDRATFGWLVVPLWVAAPFGAAIAWRRLPTRARYVAAAVSALVVGLPIAALLWQDAAFADCSNGSARTPMEWLWRASTLGAVIGGGFGISTLVATGEMRNGHSWRALTFGAIGQVAVVFAAVILVLALLFGVCQRPHLV